MFFSNIPDDFQIKLKSMAKENNVSYEDFMKLCAMRYARMMAKTGTSLADNSPEVARSFVRYLDPVMAR